MKNDMNDLLFEELEQMEDMWDAKDSGVVVGIGICVVIVVYGAIIT